MSKCWLIFEVILIMLSGTVNSQEEYDKINIYTYPGAHISYFPEECLYNENYTRVNASVKIEISEVNRINELREILIKDFEKTVHSNYTFTCYTVIDFIRSGRISHTISLNQFNNIRVNEEGPVYIASPKINKFLGNKMPYFFPFYTE